MFEDKMTRRVIVARERAFVEQWEERKKLPRNSIPQKDPVPHGIEEKKTNRMLAREVRKKKGYRKA